MKKLFRLSQKPSTPDAMSSAAGNSALSVGLHPKFNVIVPPVPHPTPYYRIAILATKHALLLRPAIPGVTTPQSCVRVPWGNTLDLENVSDQPKDSEENWDAAAVVCGIIGCLKLKTGMLSGINAEVLLNFEWTGAYILVITSKTDAGNCSLPACP